MYKLYLKSAARSRIIRFNLYPSCFLMQQLAVSCCLLLLVYFVLNLAFSYCFGTFSFYLHSMLLLATVSIILDFSQFYTFSYTFTVLVKVVPFLFLIDCFANFSLSVFFPTFSYFLWFPYF